RKLVEEAQDRHTGLGKQLLTQLEADEVTKMATGQPGAAMWLLRQNEFDRTNTFARRSRIIQAAKANGDTAAWEAAMRQVAGEFEYFWANEDRRIELISKYLNAKQIQLPSFAALRKSVLDTRKQVGEWRASAVEGKLEPGQLSQWTNEAWTKHFDLADQMHDELYRAILGNVARDNLDAAASVDEILKLRQGLRVKDREILEKLAALNKVGKRGADWDTIDKMRRDLWANGMNAENDLLKRFLNDFGQPGRAVDEAPAIRAADDMTIPPVENAPKVGVVPKVADEAAPAMSEAPTAEPLVDFTDPMPDNYDLDSNTVSLMSDGLAATANAYDSLMPTNLQGLTPEAGTAVRDWLQTVFGEMAEAQFAAYKGGEWLRDLALLNYNQRYGLNTFLGFIFPYEFWFTSSLRNWSLKFVERPNLAAMYSRARSMLQTKEEEPGYPARLRGMVKFAMPFMPEWAGDFFIDPLSSFGLPLENFPMGLSQLEYATKREDLQKQLEDAVARGATEEEIAELKNALEQAPDRGAMDYAGIFANPGLHLTLPYQLLFGKGTEGIEPIMPGSRFVKGATSLLGINEGKGIDVEGGMRKWANERLGTNFPEGDEWDLYRVERMLSDMAGDGTVTEDEARRAMIERKGPVWEQAVAQSNQEASRGPAGMVLPGRQGLYPTGERQQKLLGAEMSETYDLPDDAKKAAQSKLYDEHPEISVKQAVGDLPGSQYRDYLNDALWDLSDLDRKRLKEQYPDEVQRFYDEQATTQDLARLASAIGMSLPEMAKPKPGEPDAPFVGKPPFEVGPTVARVTPQQASAYADYLAQSEKRFGQQVYALQDQYFDLPKAQRQTFLKQNPLLREYWDARDTFKIQHPDVAKLAWPTSAAPSAFKASNDIYAQAVEILKKKNWRRPKG
ncbi:MAG: hypothetical protein WCY09_09685, partial [Candidatus Omnitrophota bacterium]